MRSHRTLVTTLGSLVLLLAACGAPADDAPPEEPEAQQPQEPDEDDDIPADLGEFSDQAIASAAAERGVAPEEIEVLRAEEVDWPDGARGCAQEGEMYTQAIVPGYLVVLDAAGEEQSWHGGQDEAPFHCEDPQTEVVGDPDDGTDPDDAGADGVDTPAEQ